jgi:hypothetical protein
VTDLLRRQVEQVVGQLLEHRTPPVVVVSCDNDTEPDATRVCQLRDKSVTKSRAERQMAKTAMAEKT